MWTCKQCKEKHTNEFFNCWKCGYDKSGVKDVIIPKEEVNKEEVKEEEFAPVGGGEPTSTATP